MTKAIRGILPVLFVVASVGAHSANAQFVYKYYQTHGGSISVGGTGEFDRILEQNPNNPTVTVPVSTGGTRVTTATGQQQYTTTSAGFLTSFQFHPVAWAGVELNYGFTHYSEKFAYSYAVSPTVTSRVTVPTDQHEATGAYLFHPKHIPFQPFVGIGGGAVDFTPSNASNQWRGAGLLEAGFDIPTHNKNLAFRVEGRSLYYRSPNFYQPAIATRSWRVQTEPAVSAVYRF